jgi:hypothetical protein
MANPEHLEILKQGFVRDESVRIRRLYSLRPSPAFAGRNKKAHRFNGG